MIGYCGGGVGGGGGWITMVTFQNRNLGNMVVMSCIDRGLHSLSLLAYDDHEFAKEEALSKFSYDSIVEAKRILWNTEYAYGELQQRKDSAKRTAKEAHLHDIMEALTHMDTLDNWNIKDVHDTFKLCIDSVSLKDIMNTKNKEDMMNQRLHMLEQKVSQLINVVDKYITENNNLKKDIEKLSSLHQKNLCRK